MKNLFILPIIAMCLFSCSDDNDITQPGGTVPGDTGIATGIALSDSTITFTSKPDTTVIHTDSKGWWIESVTVDDETADMGENEKKSTAENGRYEGSFKWLTVSYADGNIQLTATANNGPERRFNIILASQSDTVTVTGSQNALTLDEAIGLSFNNVTLDGFADTINISTEGKQWWIGSIALDGETRYSLTKEEKETLQNTGNFEKECDWLTVKCESHKITLAAKPNPGKARTFSITVETEYYTDTIAGKQNMIKIGQWPDQIKLSADSATFTAEGGTQRFATGGEQDWSIVEIDIDGDIHPASYEERMACAYEHSFNKTTGWLTVKREDEFLYVTVEPNTTGKDRTFTVTLQYGDWYSNLYGTQKSE